MGMKLAKSFWLIRVDSQTINLAPQETMKMSSEACRSHCYLWRICTKQLRAFVRLVNTVTFVESLSCRTAASSGCTVGGATFPLIRGIGTGIVPNGAIEGNDWSVYRAIFYSS